MVSKSARRETGVGSSGGVGCVGWRVGRGVAAVVGPSLMWTWAELSGDVRVVCSTRILSGGVRVLADAVG